MLELARSQELLLKAKKNSVEILEFVERHVELIKGSEIPLLWVFKNAVFS